MSQEMHKRLAEVAEVAGARLSLYHKPLAHMDAGDEEDDEDERQMSWEDLPGGE